jgi:protein TonB
VRMLSANRQACMRVNRKSTGSHFHFNPQSGGWKTEMIFLFEFGRRLPFRAQTTPSRQYASPCPMFQSVEMRGRSRRSPCCLVAILAHLLVVGLFICQINHATPLLSEASASLRSISLICPAARKQHDQTMRAEDHQTKATKLPLQQSSAEHPHIHLAAMTEAQPPEPISGLEWSNEPMQAMLPGIRGGAPVAVSLAASSASGNVAGTTSGNASAWASSSTQTKVSWEARLMSHLSQFRRYPDSARRRHEEGVVYLRFHMDRTGQVLSSRIEKSSGHTTLDQEALATLLRAQPLPAPPADRPAILDLQLPIEFYLR